jgi:hypothetical protein
MELLGMEPGKAVGVVMKALKEELLARPDMTRDEAIDFVKTESCKKVYRFMVYPAKV